MTIEPITSEGYVCIEKENNWRGCFHIHSSLIKEHLTQEQIDSILSEAGQVTAAKWQLEYDNFYKK